MGFKDWPSWVKGGVIFIILGTLAFPLFYFGANKIIADDWFGRFYPVIFVTLWDFEVADPPLVLSQQIIKISIAVVLTLIQYFVIGAILGGLFGLIKSKKQPQNLNQKGVKK